jgi:hypothetical protein
VRLEVDEQRDQRETAEERDQRDRCGPPAARHLGEAEQQRAERECRQHEPAAIELPRRRLAVLAQVLGAEGERGDAERDVDEEDPTPRRVRGDDATEHRAERRPEHARDREHRGRPGALARWERAVEHRLADRHHHPAADALRDPERDQLTDRLRQPAERGAEREDRERGEEHPLGADAVTDPTRRRDPHRQAEQVGRDHPLETGVGGVELVLDGRERHVDDRGVEHVHEDAHHERDGDDALVLPGRRGSHDRRI